MPYMSFADYELHLMIASARLAEAADELRPVAANTDFPLLAGEAANVLRAIEAARATIKRRLDRLAESALA